MTDEKTELASAARKYWSAEGYTPGGVLRKVDYAAASKGLHPSLQGIATDTGLSGSTAWDASVRARMYLKTWKPDDSDAVDSDLRELVIKKSNYGPSGEQIRMRWQNGLFVPVGTPSGLDSLAAERTAEHAFLDLLNLFTGQNQPVGPNKGPTYAPSKFAEHPSGKPFGTRRLAAAMQRLLDAGTIRIETYGRPSRPYSRLVRA